MGRRIPRDRLYGREWPVHASSRGCNAAQVDEAGYLPRKWDIHASRHALLRMAPRRQSMKGHWHDEEWLTRTSFVTRRCDKRGCRRNNAAIFLCIIPWYRVIRYVRKGPLTAAVLSTHVGSPENSTRGTYLAILLNIFSLYCMGIMFEAWCETCGVTNVHLRRKSRNARGWMLTWLNRWKQPKRSIHVYYISVHIETPLN